MLRCATSRIYSRAVGRLPALASAVRPAVATRSFATEHDPLVIVSLTGPDGNGILTKTTDAILAANGNVADSRSVVLRGTGVMMLEVRAPSVSRLRSELESALPDFHVVTIEEKEPEIMTHNFSGKFAVRGADKVGTLSQVVGFISSQNLAIKTLVTNVEEAPHSAPSGSAGTFEMKGILAASRKRKVSEAVDVQALLSGFASLERELNIKVDFEDRSC